MTIEIRWDLSVEQLTGEYGQPRDVDNNDPWPSRIPTVPRKPQVLVPAATPTKRTTTLIERGLIKTE
jgi:hypothetical protein